jgi:ATP-dependent RNA helicase DDX52/ROK1
VGDRHAAASTITQDLIFAGRESGKLLALRRLVQEGALKPPVLIFVQSKERAEQLFHELVYDNLNVDVMHADRTPAQRERVVAKFRAGLIWFLICTDLMAR